MGKQRKVQLRRANTKGCNRTERRAHSRVRKLEDRIEGVVTKLIPRRAFNRPLPEQVKMAQGMMGVAQGGMVTVRANLLRDRGMPDDIRDMRKAGKSSEEIKEYYWGCEEFRRFWEKSLEMDEGMLDQLIADSTLR